MRLSKSERLIFARSVSEFGNALRLMALPLGILKISGHVKDIALAEFLESVGAVVAGVIVPAFIDRIPRRKGLIISDLFSLACTLLMGIAFYFESLHLLFLLALLMAWGFVLHESALSAATADFENENVGGSLIRGFSKLQFWSLVVGICGALFGSAAVEHIQLWWFFVIDGVSFVASSMWILLIVSKGSTSSQSSLVQRSKGSISAAVYKSITEWKEGFFLCLKNSKLRALIASQTLLAVAHGLLVATIIGHYKTTLKVSDQRVGYAQINNRVWQVIGAFARTRISASPNRVLLVGFALMAFGYFGMAWVPFFGLLVFYGIQQFGNTLVTPTNRALCMESATPETRGRVAAFRGLSIDIGMLVGNAVAYVILSYFNSREVFVACGLLLSINFVTSFTQFQSNHRGLKK